MLNVIDVVQESAMRQLHIGVIGTSRTIETNIFEQKILQVAKTRGV